MAWESRARGGRYYTRSHKHDGRVVREYIGAGPAAIAIAELDALARADRTAQRSAERGQRSAAEMVSARVAEVDQLGEVMARAALIAAGFHQHHRGEWRRRRESHP